MAFEHLHGINGSPGPAKRTPRQVIENYVKASKERSEAIDGLIKEKMPLIGVDNGWKKYITQPWKHPEITKGLEEMGYEDPFGFNGGHAARLASILCPGIKSKLLKAATAILLLKAELSYANMFVKRDLYDFGRAVNILKYSYLFSRIMNRSGVDSGVITMVKLIGNKRKSDFNALTITPAFNWVNIDSEYFKFSFSDVHLMSALSALFTRSMEFIQCSQAETTEDTPRQMLSYHHYIKGMSLENHDGKNLPEIEFGKAFQLSPDNGEYRFFIELMAEGIMREHYFNSLYDFDGYIAGKMDEKRSADFEKLLEEHLAVRIAFELEYSRKCDKEWRGSLTDKT